ncbi:MAG: dUTP diphosphatase [Acidobacteria bacterium]|nr:dUTP diphosphatase [Acidobacteriota bacterium]
MTRGNEIWVRRLDPDLPVPGPARPGDAGLDLYAAEDAVIEPGDRVSLRTGIALAIPEGKAGFVLPRSGLAARRGIAVVNSPGLIDSGYRGEVRVLLVNLDPRDPFKIHRGDRIAQLVIMAVPPAVLVETDELPDSSRGVGGFGSTGR